MNRATHQLPEAATIVRRLMYRLGCQTLALVGCVRPNLLISLADLALYGWDEPRHVGYGAAVLPGSSWSTPDGLVDGIRAVEDPFAVLSTGLLAQLDGGQVMALAAAAAAVLVIDVDGESGLGPRSLGNVMSAVRSHGLLAIHGELIAPPDQSSPRRVSPAVLATDGHDDRPAYLVATGFHGLRLDPAIDRMSDPAPARVCIVSYEVIGPSRNGGIGTANTSLATALVRAGLDVTLIYSGEPCRDREHQRWTEHFRSSGIRYLQLSRDAFAKVNSPFSNYRRAWVVYEMVRSLHREQSFDVIHGPECQGHLAFIALAKRQGLCFEDAEIVTGVHSPSRWCAEANRQPFGFPSWLADESIERASVEASDSVISPSGYMLSYLRDRGWRLPERSFVQQYIRSDPTRLPSVPGTSLDAVDELVFFGRLETRKGLEAFCDALDLLAETLSTRTMSITFLGSSPTIGGRTAADYVTRRSSAWPWQVTLVTDASQPDAVQYLRSHRCLAVMPSLVDNSPNTVYEALALGIPFLASRSGGTGELIALEDLERCTFAGWSEDDVHLEPIPDDASPRRFDAASLAVALRQALVSGLSAAQPAVDPDLNERCHVEWHQAMAARSRLPARPTKRPRIGVIRLRGGNAGYDHKGHPARMAVTLRHGDLGDEQADSWVRWIEDERVTNAQAYNAAGRAADAELLVFIPAALSPEPDLIPVLQGAAARSDAELFLFAVRTAAAHRGAAGVSVPAPGPALLGLLFPLFHAQGFAIRSDVWRELGGFSETDRSTDPATALLTRALLEGRRTEVVPAILARSPHHDPDGIAAGGPWPAEVEQQLELLRPFAAGSGALKELPAFFRAATQSNAAFHTDSGESLRQGLRRLMLRELQRLRDRGVGLRGLLRWLDNR